MQSRALDRLFNKAVDNISARARFEAEVGWRYGLAFGVLLLSVGWGVDAFEQYVQSAGFFWMRFALAAVTIVPLTIAAAAIAGRSFGSMSRKLLVWILAGALIGFFAIRISFDGVTLLAAVVDPAARGIPVMPFTEGAQERVLPIMLVGAAGGILVGVLQVLATTWAWDRSTAENRMTLGGWITLLVSIPLAIGLGAIFDGVADSQLRAPAQLINRVIQLALATPPDLDRESFQDTGRLLDYVATSRWRSQFTPRYTQYLAQFDPITFRSSYADVQFTSGYIWRCEAKVNGSILGACNDVQETYRDYMVQFLRSGAVRCDNCLLQIAPAAASWRLQQASDLTGLDQVSLVHHIAGIIVADVSGANGKRVQCRLYGAEPVVIHDCTRVQ